MDTNKLIKMLEEKADPKKKYRPFLYLGSILITVSLILAIQWFNYKLVIILLIFSTGLNFENYYKRKTEDK